MSPPCPTGSKGNPNFLPCFHPFSLLQVFLVSGRNSSGAMPRSQGVKTPRALLMQRGAATPFCFGNRSGVTDAALNLRSLCLGEH